jgi:hypothetical protein
VAYGQTRFAPGVGIDNPQTNTEGVIGAVDVLPYLVPGGKNLVITGYGIEGYDIPGVVVIVPHIECGARNQTPDSAYRITRQLPSVAAKAGSSEFGAAQFRIASGCYVNVRLLNGTSGDYVHGWYVSGVLIDEAY